MAYTVQHAILCFLFPPVLYNSEPDPRFPILSEFMRTKELVSCTCVCLCIYNVHVHVVNESVVTLFLQEENEGGELLGFNTVASKLLAVVTAPIHSALVSKHEQVRSIVKEVIVNDTLGYK